MVDYKIDSLGPQPRARERPRDSVVLTHIRHTEDVYWYSSRRALYVIKLSM